MPKDNLSATPPAAAEITATESGSPEAAGTTVFRWAGNAGWLIEYGGRLIAVDLDMASERLWAYEESLSDIARRIDYVFATHAHGDHFNIDTYKYLIDHGNCTLVLPHSCAGSVEKASIDGARIIWAVPGQAMELEPWLRVEPTHALHGHIARSVYSGANFDDCGYLFTIGGMRVCHPGDSVLLHEHLEISNINVLFVSPTEHNMHVEGCRSLIEAINPDHIFAQHFGTYPVTDANSYWTTGYEEPLRLALSSKHRSRYIIPEPGKSYAIKNTRKTPL